MRYRYTAALANLFRTGEAHEREHCLAGQFFSLHIFLSPKPSESSCSDTAKFHSLHLINATLFPFCLQLNLLFSHPSLFSLGHYDAVPTVHNPHTHDGCLFQRAPQTEQVMKTFCFELVQLGGESIIKLSSDACRLVKDSCDNKS